MGSAHDKKLAQLDHQLQEHSGQWVAIVGLAVVGAGNTPEIALQKAKASGQLKAKDPVLQRVPKDDGLILAL